MLARVSTPQPKPRRRWLAVAVATVIAASLAVLAVPPARTAVFDWLGIGGARIVEVDELPALAPTPGLEFLGDPVSVDRARAQAGFPFADPPDDEPAPDEVLLAPGTRVSYVWREGDRVRLLITQFPGTATDPGLLKKYVGPTTRLEELTVDGARALWLEGGPHVVQFVAPDGNVRQEVGWLAGNTLLVDHGATTLRIEAQIERAEAVELAETMTG